MYRMHLCHVKYEIRYGTYRKALEWLHPLLMLKRDILRDSTILQTKLYELVIHTELNNIDLALSRKLSLKLWLKETNHWKSCWMHLFIKGLDAHLNQQSSGMPAKPLALDYQEEEQSNLGRIVFKEYDYWSWLQGKLAD
jgi:hypothetical protein